MHDRKIENLTPFVRLVTETTYHADGQSLTSYRESRPWVVVAIGATLLGFCIWLFTVTQVGDILLGR